MNFGAEKMLIKKLLCCDLALPIVSGFVDRATWLTQSAMMTRVHAIYSPTVSKVMSANVDEDEISKS